MSGKITSLKVITRTMDATQALFPISEALLGLTGGSERTRDLTEKLQSGKAFGGF